MSELIDGSYETTTAYAIGTIYGPLQGNGFDFICPDCGSYGYVPGNPVCPYCEGAGFIARDDKRVVDYDPRNKIS